MLGCAFSTSHGFSRFFFCGQLVIQAQTCRRHPVEFSRWKSSMVFFCFVFFFYWNAPIRYLLVLNATNYSFMSRVFVCFVALPVWLFFHNVFISLFRYKWKWIFCVYTIDLERHFWVLDICRFKRDGKIDMSTLWPLTCNCGFGLIIASVNAWLTNYLWNWNVRAERFSEI